MVPRLMSIVLLFAISVTASFAAGISESAKLDTFWKAPSPIIINDGEANSKSVDFPALSKKPGFIPVVRFKAYLDMAVCGGWSNYTQLKLNGTVLDEATADGKTRLLNRGKTIESKGRTENVFVNSRMITMFGPGTGEVDDRLVSQREEGYWYLLDISDAANYVQIGADNRVESQKPNLLDISTTVHFTSEYKRFVVENLEVGYLPISQVRKLQAGSLINVAKVQGPSISAGKAKLTVGQNGALSVTNGGESWFVTALYSYPGGDTIKYNRFGETGDSAPDWKTAVASGKHKIILTGDWQNYTVKRTIKSEGGKFRVSDQIINKTDKPLGMKVRYTEITPEAFEKDKAFICGSGSLLSTENCPTNPSIYIAQKKAGLGLVVEDTLLRLQMDAMRKENSIEFGTNHFGLEPGKSYTMRWTIYPMMSTDYWDFVNRVRKEWKVNFTVLGPYPFGDENVLPARKAAFYSPIPWFRYYAGEGLTPEETKAVLQPKIKKILEEQPDAIVIGNLETNLVPFDTRLSPVPMPIGTRETPAKRIGSLYGYELDKAQTEYLKTLPWWDSICKTEDGRALVDAFYANAPYTNMMVYPAPGNYHLGYMKWQVDYMMDEIGVKGIYIDQFNLGIRLAQPGRSDYSKWDGHTVDLKPNGEISRAYTDCTYVGSPARAEIVRHVLDKGGIFVANGHPVAEETNGLKMLTFAETEWDLGTAEELLSWNEPPYIPSIGEAHLSSPISLGIRPDRFGQFGIDHWAEIMQKWVITCLKNGTVYYYYENMIPEKGPGAGDYGIINHMFPFTPVELHAGCLIGKERILTAKSGSFFWNKPIKPTVLAFNLKGYQIQPKSVNMEKKGKGWQVELKINDWQETAVIKDPAEK